MRTHYSYESILRAVGQVLDHTGVKSIAIQETETGIVIEGMNREGHTHVRLAYDLSDLVSLIDRTEGNETDEHDVISAEQSHTLADFLARHQTVLAR